MLLFVPRLSVLVVNTRESAGRAPYMAIYLELGLWHGSRSARYKRQWYWASTCIMHPINTMCAAKLLRQTKCLSRTEYMCIITHVCISLSLRAEEKTKPRSLSHSILHFTGFASWWIKDIKILTDRQFSDSANVLRFTGQRRLTTALVWAYY